MRRFRTLVLLMLSSASVWSDTLVIAIKDVMDLAIYKEALSSAINLAEGGKTKTFTIKKWHSCFADDCSNYQINLAVEVEAVKSELTDSPTYVVTVKKVLLANNQNIFTLTNQSFTLTAGQEQRVSDYYWHKNELIVRQENVFVVR